MPVEFLHGRPLSPEELELIRRQIEQGFEVIGAVDDEIRGIVARNWPHLLSKLPPEDDECDPNGSVIARLRARRSIPPWHRIGSGILE